MGSLHNDQFKKFIDQTEKILTSDKRVLSAVKKELEEFSDKYFKTDSEAEKYAKEKNLPTDQE